jgi:hypothetical protein
MWPQDITANLDSVNASELAAKQHLDGVAHELHAYEFLLYACLQDGNDAHAKKIYESTDSMIRHRQLFPVSKMTACISTQAICKLNFHRSIT